MTQSNSPNRDFISASHDFLSFDMLTDHHPVSAPLGPDELDMLQRIFDDACTVRGVAKGSSDAANIAGIVLAVYERGIRREEALKAMVR